MPLTDSSKSKVSLTSLSATTVAAAETLWSKSKKSSRKKQLSSQDSNVTPEVSNVSTIKSSSSSVESVAAPPINSNQNQIHPQPLDRHEFRRKFLEGLQFYCENSSLILNSDLPADLIEFVTSHGFSVESLGIILELKKSSSAFSAYVDKKGVPSSSSVLYVNSTGTGGDKQVREQNFSEISRRLLQHWMSADSCAEAFVSLSLGEEIPGLIAECACFQRILFSVPENFNIPGKDFIGFLLSQVLLAINALAYGIKKSSETCFDSNAADKIESEPVKVRSHVLASFLDRIFMRYFSDSEYFYGHTVDDDNAANYKSSGQGNPFKTFIAESAVLSRNNVIGRRLVSKMLQHLSSHSTSKLAKVIFSSKKLDTNQTVASLILYPSLEFLENNSQWKFILQSLPSKVVTRSKSFWMSWAEFVEAESKSWEKFWITCADHWIILNKSSLVDEQSLFSATLAIAALARQIKQNRIIGHSEEKTLHYLTTLELGKILQNIIHSLESINAKKRDCGMALAQIVADMQFALYLLIPKQGSSSDAEAELPKKLEFDCKSIQFLEIIDFYRNGMVDKSCLDDDADDCADLEELHDDNDNASASMRAHRIEVLDSDDDAEENVEDDGIPELGVNMEDEALSAGVAMDPRIMILQSRKRKMPNYFSEIVETLLESSKNEDEAEILRYIVVLKIPVLISVGVKVDAKMALTICKCLLDMEDGTSLEIPIQLALYELFLQHPFEIADGIGHVVFDKDHYALGQRLMNLTRLSQILLLASKQTCFSCYSDALIKHERELAGIYPEFSRKYFDSRKKLRFCNECRSSTNVLQKSSDEDRQVNTALRKQEKQLTWREIVDQRVAAKTRYFFSPKTKTPISVPDEFSTKLLPVLWSSIANRLTSKTSFYLDKVERASSGNMHDIFLVKIFQYLSKCILGTSGPNCPHIRNVASHAGELVTHFVHHEDAIVRRNVLSLLGVVLSVGEGKVFVIEALSSQDNILKLIDRVLEVEKDPENQNFIKQIQKYFASCTTAGLLEQHLDIN